MNRPADTSDVGTPPEPAAEGPTSWPRYGIGSMMLVTVIFAVMAASARQLVVAVRHGSSPKAFFVIFTLAAPMLAVVAISVFRQVASWLSRQVRR